MVPYEYGGSIVKIWRAKGKGGCYVRSGDTMLGCRSRDCNFRFRRDRDCSRRIDEVSIRRDRYRFSRSFLYRCCGCWEAKPSASASASTFSTGWSTLGLGMPCNAGLLFFSSFATVTLDLSPYNFRGEIFRFWDRRQEKCWSIYSVYVEKFYTLPYSKSENCGQIRL